MDAIRQDAIESQDLTHNSRGIGKDVFAIIGLIEKKGLAVPVETQLAAITPTTTLPKGNNGTYSASKDPEPLLRFKGLLTPERVLIVLRLHLRRGDVLLRPSSSFYKPTTTSSSKGATTQSNKLKTTQSYSALAAKVHTKQQDSSFVQQNRNFFYIRNL
ncbi:unnamed protein product [Allacma fusca]|uniref:Uncharacterized protein n=1 Tax=Allacma fusca TaxID=39272 RepID=A0A8J2KZT8_9HEXA|nr:unnamed protein product [Allacma fusca]